MSLDNNNYARGEPTTSRCLCTHNRDTCVELRFDMLVLGVPGYSSLHVLAENDKAGVSWLAKLAANDWEPLRDPSG